MSGRLAASAASINSGGGSRFLGGERSEIVRARDCESTFAATFGRELAEIPDFALPDDLQASGMNVVREGSASARAQLLDSRCGQLARRRAVESCEDTQFELRRGVSQEFADGDFWLIVRLQVHSPMSKAQCRQS